ncbi:MAG: glycosyl hydrolase 115 family protein [Verrucomicrobia bacterium]|nr:glycosyl hydrolase 115 family protein [Verrucomicrobiota bacterium]
MRSATLLAFWLCGLSLHAALGDAPFVVFSPESGAFALVENKTAAPLFVDDADWPGVRRAVGDLQADFERVSGMKPVLAGKIAAPQKTAVIIGTLGRSALIDELVRTGKIDTTAIVGRWEAFLIQVVDNPRPGLDRALVIAGSDKRGTIYGIYELSAQIGVSPWYWWADVPTVRHEAIFTKAVRLVETGPAVKYRGIFLNDEAPALTGWANEKFGGLNSAFYAKVFELILRLRGNYLWPAMWNNAFNEDDPANPRLADEYGIVMGTSHHEPMIRSQQEWKRNGTGEWNFNTNPEGLKKFWTDGIRRNSNFESLVTMGMRGDGDEPMSEESNVALLQRIVSDQREILARETGRPVEAIPQLWALYKEVQEYYERGMRVPDDITLLWCDDNWGNIRRLPTDAERKRPGGAGVYYHFDYVGGPRSYRWLNTNPLPKVWEQMHLAWQYGADRIWIVNVGDLKPMEVPIEFFLTYGWAPQRWPQERVGEFLQLWAAREFGPAQAGEIAELVATYTKFNGSRKPELLAPDTFSLVNYGEAERVVASWHDLIVRAERVNAALPNQARDAFFQLVLWPIKASATVAEMHVAAGRNRLYALQSRASTNTWGERTRALFHADAALTSAYNDTLAGGKWKHFADQTHIGYTNWAQPDRNAMPAITELQLPVAAEMAVAVEGRATSWPSSDWPPRPLVLPPLSPFGVQSRWIEVFNRGLTAFEFTASADVPWLRVTPSSGRVNEETRLMVSVDWSVVPAGQSSGTINITRSGQSVSVQVPIDRRISSSTSLRGFVESDGVIAIEAEHFHRTVSAPGLEWKTLAGLGRTLSGVTVFPVTATSQTLGADSLRLEYDVVLASSGEVKVEAVLSPTLPFQPGRGLRFAVSFDDAAPQVVEIRGDGGEGRLDWERMVSEGVRKVITKHRVDAPGAHVFKFWMIDPGVILQRLVVDCGGLRPSYFGPPESARVGH